MESVEFSNDYYHKQTEMIEWCKKNVGHGGWFLNKLEEGEPPYKWSVISMFGRSKFTFENDKDATLFSLRWVGQYES